MTVRPRELRSRRLTSTTPRVANTELPSRLAGPVSLGQMLSERRASLSAVLRDWRAQGLASVRAGRGSPQGPGVNPAEMINSPGNKIRVK